MNYEEAIKSLDQYLRTYHSIGVDDVEITDTKGYWRLKKVCGQPLPITNREHVVMETSKGCTRGQ